MSHNVYQHIESVQRANALADLATKRLDIDWRSFQKAKGKSLEIDPWVPRKILFMNKFIDELFRTENPMSLLEEARPLLAEFNGTKSLTSTDSAFGNLFETDSPSSSSLDEFTEEQAEQAEDVLATL
jgi:hypothetical protein